MKRQNPFSLCKNKSKTMLFYAPFSSRYFIHFGLYLFLQLFFELAHDQLNQLYCLLLLSMQRPFFFYITMA